MHTLFDSSGTRGLLPCYPIFMRTICRRLRRGDDLLLSIKRIAAEEHIELAAIISGVGCISKGRVRDASGVTIRDITGPCEIVSIGGTVSEKRCHIHIALSKEDLSTIGGHLVEGCIINTTCELMLLELDGWKCNVEQDSETGYDEMMFEREMK